jgi:hypothetical protein
VNFRTAVRYLQALCVKGWVHPIPCGKGIKVLQYMLIRTNLDEFDW